MSDKKEQTYKIVGQSNCGEFSEAGAYLVEIDRQCFEQICRMRKIAEENKLDDVHVWDDRTKFTRLTTDDLEELVRLDDKLEDDACVSGDVMTLSVGDFGFCWEGYEPAYNTELSTQLESWEGVTWKEIVAMFTGQAGEIKLPADLKKETFLVQVNPETARDSGRGDDGRALLRVTTPSGQLDFEEAWNEAAETCQDNLAEVDVTDVVDQLKSDHPEIEVTYEVAPDLEVTY